ncbi:menaquinone biosynthetic enzyme MqnA/MqnD family protein [Sphingobacterium corticibacterium]|uniref:Chorismate dehydratase n=1 Tax=Sphingobacterium corticibacterium TaxID=2484746 RepID=A0A4Q6XZK6_9SPHI|nr:menaquinone biosynthesis protein [Sphingobacterium corticibacterium]RZF62066.1 radical SAM protein [Sphingobacterium corticibacterium]
MRKIAVSAVSYTNTLPFLNGIRNSDVINVIDLSVDYPSECARKVIENEVDMGIIPIAALAKLSDYQIVGDYCIGSNGAVDSVFIFSEKPINEIETLLLDKQSRTSNGLAQILLKHYWKKDIQVLTEGQADAHVLIGDRTFGKKSNVPFAYDMGYYWKEMTGLPFAFAVWVANKRLPDDFKEAFNNALAEGVAHPEGVIPGLPIYEDFDYYTYLTESLDFHLTADKRKAIDLYLELYKAL